MDKKLLDNGTVYAMVDISNLLTINADKSRRIGDEIIKMFTEWGPGNKNRAKQLASILTF